MVTQKNKERTGVLESRFGSLGHIIIGIDEVGRGALAGPITIGAVALEDSLALKIAYDCHLSSWMDPLTDSKKLTPSMREVLTKKIQEEALAYATTHSYPVEIDKYGISDAFIRAADEAVARVLEQLEKSEDDWSGFLILTDGNVPIYHDRPDIQSTAIPKADALSWSVAAASVIAKVKRDRIMTEISPDAYNFARHKGYGTKEHYRLLRIHGASGFHRRSFNLKI